jgi:hypothetical protein
MRERTFPRTRESLALNTRLPALSERFVLGAGQSDADRPGFGISRSAESGVGSRYFLTRLRLRPQDFGRWGMKDLRAKREEWLDDQG